MKNFQLIALLIIAFSITFFNCSRKIEKETIYTGKEQVDLSQQNPLAQFSSKEDTLNLFDTFTNYSEKKINTKSKQKIAEEITPIYYFVQVGLTDSYEEISQLKNQITSIFPDEKIEIKYDSPFYRVLIGPFDSKSKANEIFSILERKNFSSIRIRTEISK